MAPITKGPQCIRRLTQIQMSSHIKVQNKIPVAKAGTRLDQVAAELFPDYSRSRIKEWCLSGELKVNGVQVKPNIKVTGGELIEVDAQLQQEGDWQPEALPLDIVYEDESILVINKPADLVVHPASGNWTGTLLNGLLHHHEPLINVPRAGIVHRLDKDTTGLMVVAKTIEAQTHLVEQLQARTVKREYEALTWGCPEEDGSVEADIGRHPTVRTKMAVVSNNGKPAKTHYEVKADLEWFAHLRLRLETGRTHQIRVHMAHIGYPLLGDPLYGKKLNRTEQKSIPSYDVIHAFPRQALHAAQLGLVHPASGEYCQWQAALPEDFCQLKATIEDTL